MKQPVIQPNSQPTSALMLRETASQTAGPYVHIGLALAAAGNPTRDEEIWNEMARPDAEGEHIEVVGTVIDGNGEAIGVVSYIRQSADGRTRSSYAVPVIEGNALMDSLRAGEQHGLLPDPHRQPASLYRGVAQHQRRDQGESDQHGLAEPPVR